MQVSKDNNGKINFVNVWCMRLVFVLTVDLIWFLSLIDFILSSWLCHLGYPLTNRKLNHQLLDRVIFLFSQQGEFVFRLPSIFGECFLLLLCTRIFGNTYGTPTFVGNVCYCLGPNSYIIIVSTCGYYTLVDE